MSRKKVLLVLLIILTLFSSPIYSQGYENTSIIKLIFQLIFYLVIFIAVIFLTLYGTKFIAKNSKGIAGGKYVKLLDATNIPGGSKIIITEINKTIYILSVSNNETTVIDKIDSKDFPLIEESFDTYLDKYLINDKFNYEKLNKKVKAFLNKFKRIKSKEEKKDEKQD